MKTKILVLLLFSLTLSLSSCDPYILKVAIDNNGFEKNFNFGCGKVNVRCSVLADRQISTLLNFRLSSPVLINPEKLEIIHKGELLTPKVFLGNGGGLMQEARNINNDSKISIVINRAVKAGDTIIVNIDNFILCRDKPLEIGNISLVLVQR